MPGQYPIPLPQQPARSPHKQDTHALGVGGEMRLIESAVRRGYDITPEVRERALAAVERALGSPDGRTQMAAVRALAALEGINLKRESLDHSDRHADNRSQIEILKALMATEDGRKLLSKMEGLLPNSSPVPEPAGPDNPGVSGGDSSPPPARADKGEGEGGS